MIYMKLKGEMMTPLIKTRESWKGDRNISWNARSRYWQAYHWNQLKL